MLSQFLLTQVFAFMLIFCRVGSAMMLLPGFSEAYVTAQIRLMIALFLSILLVPTVHMPVIPGDMPHLFVLIIGEILTGVFIGGLSYLLISTIQMTSAIIAYQTGLSSALTLGLGQSAQQETALDNLLSYSAVVLLFTCDLHHYMLRGLADSYTLFAPGQFPLIDDFASHATHMMSIAFQTAMQLAAPSLVVGLMLNLGSGILSRLMPNFQIFFIMIAPQLMLGFLVLMVTISSIMLWYMDYMRTNLATFLTPGADAMADEDEDQKTEQPTQKRIDEAYKKGNVPFSREIGNFMIMLMIALTVSWFAPDIMTKTANLLSPFLGESWDMPADASGIGMLMAKLVLGGMSVIAVPVVCVIVALLASSFMQNGIILSNEPIMPQLSRISPLAGLKRLFSMRSAVEFAKSLLKIGVVGYVCFISIYPELTHIRQLPNSSAMAMLLFLAMLAKRMTIAAAIIMFFIAIFDLMWQRFQFIKSLRMTRQEIRDEYKQSEGDPMIKQRLRRLRQERARNRMMSNVPKADVVITNPTHFAVALQYTSKKMKAPVVVAKGQDLIALRIRELAKENDIPVVENPPLARALFDSTEIEQEIPAAHYEAVAKVISYVYQLKGKRL